MLQPVRWVGDPHLCNGQCVSHSSSKDFIVNGGLDNLSSSLHLVRHELGALGSA